MRLGAPSDRLTSGLGRRPMNVKTILSLQGSNVITIEPHATLEAAVAMLAKHRIGALVVLGADQRVIGILSERDIVRALAELGASALTTQLAQVMTRKVVTCSEAETVGGVMERMTIGKFRHVPVLEQDRLVGIVSIGDGVRRMSRQPRPHHGEYLVDHRILVVAAARERLHRRGIEPAVLDEAVVDMDADHLSEHHVALRGAALEITQVDDLQQLALERA